MPSLDYGRASDLTATLEDRLVARLRGDGPTASRRSVLGGLGALGSAAIAGGSSGGFASAGDHEGDDGTHGNFGAEGEYGSGFDPHKFLRTFNTGDAGDHASQDNLPQETYTDDQGRTVRHFTLPAIDTQIEVAPGVTFTAWAYNGQVPGPTLRAQEGDIIEIEFDNLGAHAHTIHPHLKNIDPAMDGTPTNGPGVIDRGEGTFTYRWQAKPAGVHFYHCHSLPLKEHLHRGLYGTIIVDPDPARVRETPNDYVQSDRPIASDSEYADILVERAESRNFWHPRDRDSVDELVMVMNGFDTNFDGDNEVYAANTRAFAYGVGETNGKGDWVPGETKRPIQIDKTQRQRVYLINAVEFDPINSFHTHSQFFDYYDHGTTLAPTHNTIDTIMQCQAQRGIIELNYGDHDPGLYMFHAHQSEFAELGWMSFFEVV